MHSQGNREAIALAVRLADGLSVLPLPEDTPAKLRGDLPMSPSDRSRIIGVFEDAVTSPRITEAQRDRLQSLIDDVIPAVAAPPPPGSAGPPPFPAVVEAEPAPRAVPQVPRRQEPGKLQSRRRWPRVLASLFLISGLGVTSWLAWSNYRTGLDWQERAIAAEADVDRLDVENDTLEGDVADLEESLKRSEADVTLLERRLSRAANEKARVEDEREQANAFAERIAEVALAYDDVASWFSACRQEQSTLTSMVFDFEDYYLSGQTYLISSQINRAADTCGTAEQELAGLRSYISSLGQ